MNINDKRIQYLILGVLVGCGLFFLILYFLILPSVRSWKENSAKAAEIQKQLSEMRQIIQARTAVKSQIETAKAAIKNYAANIPLPVLGNYLLGMENHLNVCAGNSGVTVVSIADNDIVEITRENSRFKIYRVRMQVQSGFHDYVRLAESIYNSNPLCAISGINIAARNDTPLVHEMSFIVSWLVWSDPAKRPDFLMEDRK